MPTTEERLYVALKDRGDGTQSYHWALWSGPDDKKGDKYGTLYHATDGEPTMGTWRVERQAEYGTGNTGKEVARVLIGKVKDPQRLNDILTAVPMSDPPNCRLWLRDAIATLADHPRVMGTAILDWETIETKGWEFATEAFNEGWFDPDWVATWDLLEDRRTRP